MKKILFLLCLVLVISGCTNSIKEIKSPDYIGKRVVVSGKVTSSIKLGKLSGFLIEDKDGEIIGVSCETLPKEGDVVVVSGVLMKDSIFQYYIHAENVR